MLPRDSCIKLFVPPPGALSEEYGTRVSSGHLTIKQMDFLSHMLLPWGSVSPLGQSNQSLTRDSKTTSQNKPLFSVTNSSQMFVRFPGKLTQGERRRQSLNTDQRERETGEGGGIHTIKAKATGAACPQIAQSTELGSNLKKLQIKAINCFFH